jgi:hypothetical protein
MSDTLERYLVYIYTHICIETSTALHHGSELLRTNGIKTNSVLLYSNQYNLCIYIPFPIRWLICMLSVFSALSPLRSIRRRTQQNGRTSDKCLLSSSRSSFSAIELMQANTYVDESCSIPWRGYLHASSHRSCQQVPVFDNIILYKTELYN